MAHLAAIAQVTAESWLSVPTVIWVAACGALSVIITEAIKSGLLKRQPPGTPAPPPAAATPPPDVLTSREWLARIDEIQTDAEMANDRWRQSEMEAERLRGVLEVRAHQIEQLREALAVERNRVQQLLAEQHFREKA